jgi:hypothetical protein
MLSIQVRCCVKYCWPVTDDADHRKPRNVFKSSSNLRVKRITVQFPYFQMEKQELRGELNALTVASRYQNSRFQLRSGLFCLSTISF